MCLAFEPSQDEHHHRSAFLALKQGGQPVLDYIRRARHLASCIIADPINTVTQVHAFVTGMNAGHQRFYLTRKPSASLEEAFSVALREDISVMASQMDQSSPPRAAHAPDPVESDAIEHATGQRRAPSCSFHRPATAQSLFIARPFAARLLQCSL